VHLKYGNNSAMHIEQTKHVVTRFLRALRPMTSLGSLQCWLGHLDLEREEDREGKMGKQREGEEDGKGRTGEGIVQF